MSPRSEGWLPVRLNADGKMDARSGANFIKKLPADQWPQPEWIIASDLLRTLETANITAETLGMGFINTLESIRAYDEGRESPEEFEQRNVQGFDDILSRSGIPLIVAHRSTTGFLDQQYGHHAQDTDWNPDYSTHSLLLEGGVLAITDDGLVPLFRALEENWPDQRGRTRYDFYVGTR